MKLIETEGAFYIWTSGEIKDVLGDDAPIFGYVFAVKQGGNVDKQHDAHGEMTGRVSFFCYFLCMDFG